MKIRSFVCEFIWPEQYLKLSSQMSTEKNKVGTLDTTQTWFERRGTGFPSKRALNAVDWFPAHRECTVPCGWAETPNSHQEDKFICAHIFMSESLPKSSDIQFLKIERLVAYKNLRILTCELYYELCT